MFRILPSFLWRQQYIIAPMPPSQIRCCCCNMDSKQAGWMMSTDFKVNKVFFFYLYCYPALVSFVRTQSGESTRQSERAPWCMSLYTQKKKKVFGKLWNLLSRERSSKKKFTPVQNTFLWHLNLVSLSTYSLVNPLSTKHPKAGAFHSLLWCCDRDTEQPGMLPRLCFQRNN